MADVGELWAVSMGRSGGREYIGGTMYPLGPVVKRRMGIEATRRDIGWTENYTTPTRAHTHLSSAERHGMLGVCGGSRLLIGLCVLWETDICTSVKGRRGSLIPPRYANSIGGII